MAYTATFEAGSNGNAITTGGGEASATAWWAVNGTPTYSNTHTAHGSLAAKISGSDGSADLAWDSITDGYGRAYLYATANPSGTTDIVLHNGAWSFICSSVGTFRVFDSAGGFTDASSTLALNQWVRFEWHVTYSATVGQVELKIFSADSTSATETVTSPASWNTGTGGSYLTYRCRSWGADVWLDDLVANATTWPGPGGVVAEKQTVYFARARYVSGRR